MIFNDVNEWHQVTDRAKYVAAGNPMIEIRCMSGSSGTMLTDKTFRQHRERFKNFPRLYYFFPFNKADAKTQAKWFGDTLGYVGPDEMIMLDIEAGSHISDPVGFTREFLKWIEYRFHGNKCWVYLPKSLASKEMYNVIGDRVIKAPRFSGNAGRGAPPNWGHWDVHQYTDKGPMPGSPHGPGDCNFTNLSVSELFARSKYTEEVDPPKTNLLLLGG